MSSWFESEPNQIPLPFFLFSFLKNLGWECGCSCPVTYKHDVCCAQVTKLLLCMCCFGREDMASPLVISASIRLSVFIHLSQSVPWPRVQHTLTIHAQLSLSWAIQKSWQVVKLFFLYIFYFQMVADNMFGTKLLYLHPRGLEQVFELSTLGARRKSSRTG